MKRLNLQKMIGPLPLGAWLAVVVVGVGLAYMARRRSMMAGPLPAPAAATEPGYPTTSGVAVPLGTSATGMTSPADAPLTNAAWVIKATTALVGLGRPQGAFAISQALGKYVAFGTSSITAAEKTIVEDAIRTIGLPPEGVNQISIGGQPSPPVTPTTPTHSVRITYVLPGETPNAIAIRLRRQGLRTPTGADLTAAYLIRFNQWTTSATAPRWPGEKVFY